MSHGVSFSCVWEDKTSWVKWCDFNSCISIRSDISNTKGPVLIFQIFSHRVSTSLLVESSQNIQKLSINQYVRSAGHILNSVGSIDPWLYMMGNINFCIRRQIAKYHHEDPAPPMYSLYPFNYPPTCTLSNTLGPPHNATLHTFTSFPSSSSPTPSNNPMGDISPVKLPSNLGMPPYSPAPADSPLSLLTPTSYSDTP